MTKQEQIEEISKIVDEMYNVYTTTADDIAEGIYNAGYRKEQETAKEIERLEADNQILIEALQYMAGIYGFRPSVTKLDDEIEYSCNHYVTDKETWLVLKNAEKIIDWWE